MKKQLLALLCLLSIILIACKSHLPVSQQSGKSDIAYLLFLRRNSALKEVRVKMSNPDIEFVAKTVKTKKEKYKGEQYQVATGTRNITVYDEDNKIIYQSKLFLQQQEVKQIEL